MRKPLIVIDRLLLVLAVILALAAVALAILAPGFALDNGLVYGGF